MILFLFATVLFLCLIHILFNYNENARFMRKIPGPKDVFIFGNGLEILVSSVELFKYGRKLAETCNGIYRFWAFPIAAINIYNPDDIEEIISSTKHNNKSPVYLFLKPWLREGLLVSQGEKWHQRRKILTPTFHFNILRQFCLILEENSQRLVKILEATAGKSTDIVSVVSEFTLNSICETAMGTQLREETLNEGKSYKDAIHKIGKCFVARFSRVHLYSDFIYNLTSIGRRQKKYLNVIHKFTARVIKDRKESFEKYGIVFNENTVNNADDVLISSKKKKIAMLDLLISAEKDGLIDNIGIQEEVDTFMFEGHDTTASGLTYCLMLLANNKKVQDKIVTELRDIFGNSKRPTTYEDLSKMKYLECCIKESLRLYPPVPFISRNVNEKITLSNYTIPPGVHCHIHIYDLHRREELFKNPLVYDPDRFLPENSVGRHPYAYIPFSAGPRNCIGQKFAVMEMKLAISAILREFEMLPVTKPSDLEFIADIVLRNSHPIYVTFIKRDNM